MRCALRKNLIGFCAMHNIWLFLCAFATLTWSMKASSIQRIAIYSGAPKQEVWDGMSGVPGGTGILLERFRPLTSDRIPGSAPARDLMHAPPSRQPVYRQILADAVAAVI
jgi:hypothetical protein